MVPAYSEARTLNTELAEHGFLIYGIFHEMFMTRKQNGGQNNSTILCNIYLFDFLWGYDPTRVIASSFSRFLDHTQ